MLWPLERAAEIMRWYREFITTASEEINGFFAFLSVPPGPPFPEHLHLKNMCGIVWCYAGAWARDYWEALHPYSAGGAYLNFIMDEGEDRVRASYRENYDRLVAIKNRYDPTNLFRVNQNIKPSV
jgi:FAD/FMN-containing dehydrogenase